MSRSFALLVVLPNTGPPAYSDIAGTAKKCHCKRVSFYMMIFSNKKILFGDQQIFTVARVALKPVSL